jgi:photosystem II stability/assembly factor-like uncharacterized protein
MPTRLLGALVVVVVTALGASVSGVPAGGASSGTVVTATVPSVSTIDVSACGPATTDFGTVLPGTSVVTAQDCTVTFGASSDTARLRLHQQDGGGQAMARRGFASRTSGVPQRINFVRFFDHDRAWAVGDNGRILQSTDAGVTWTVVPSGVPEHLFGIDFATASRGWAIGNSSVIITTGDGGATWTPQTAAIPSMNLHEIDAIDANTAWAVGPSGTILRTVDGGTNWTTQTSGVTEDLRGLSAIDAQTAWVVGNNGVILRTTNGGTTWQSLPAAPINLQGVDALSATTAWAAGAGGTVMRTTDSGATWSTVNVGTAQSLRAIAVVDATTAWVAGNGSTVAMTTDTGATWTTVPTIAAATNLEAVAALDGNLAIVAGAGGVIERSPLDPIPDYRNLADAFDTDWSTGTAAFGACLRELGAGATADWTEDANCDVGDGARWRGVPATTGDTASSVAATDGSGSTTASLRFGLRTATAQQPGVYRAYVTFDVIAPAT